MSLTTNESTEPVDMILVTLIDEDDDQTPTYMQSDTPAVCAPDQNWRLWVEEFNEGEFCVRDARIQSERSTLGSFPSGTVLLVKRGIVWCLMRREE